MLISQFQQHRRFIENVATLMAGRVVAAGVALLLVPVIARLFTPSDFGVAAAFIAVPVTFVTLSTLCLERAALLPEDDIDAARLVLIALGSATLLSCALWLVQAVFWLLDLSVPLAAELGIWVWALPAAVWLWGAVSVSEFWLLRFKQFRRQAMADAGQSIGSGVVRVAGGFAFGSSTWVLITGNLVAVAGKLVVNAVGAVRQPIQAALKTSSFGEYRAVASRHRDFVIFNTPAGFVRNTTMNLPILALTPIFGVEAAGLYAMAYRLCLMPLNVAIGAVRRTYLQRTAEIVNSGRSLSTAYFKTTGVLIALGLVPALVVWQFGEPLLTWLLGVSWTGSGEYLELVAPMLFAIWIAAPAAASMVVLRIQHMWLLIQTSALILSIAVFVVAWRWDWTARQAIECFVVVQVAASVVAILVIWMNIRGYKPRAQSTQRPKALI